MKMEIPSRRRSRTEPDNGQIVDAVPRSTDSDAILAAAITAVLAAYPDLWWGGWGDRPIPVGDSLEGCRREMTQPHCIEQVRRALKLIEQAKRTKTVSRQISTYAWKHRAERLYRVNTGDDWVDYYVGEGAFIAAAIMSGLTVKRTRWGTLTNLSRKSFDYSWWCSVTGAEPPEGQQA